MLISIRINILHSQFMTKIQVGHVDKSWSNLGQLRFDQDFTSWPRFDQHFTIGNLDLGEDLTNALVKTSPKSMPSNLSHNDQPLTKIRLRILGLGYECNMLCTRFQPYTFITHSIPIALQEYYVPPMLQRKKTHGKSLFFQCKLRNGWYCRPPP